MNKRDTGGPRAHPEKRQNHLRQDTAMHLHEDGPFRVLLDIARPAEIVVEVQGRVLSAERVRGVNPRRCE